MRWTPDLRENILGCCGEEKSLTIEFPVLDWEANYSGILHGGIICTMLDHTARRDRNMLYGRMDADGGFGRAFSAKGRGRRYFAEQSKD